MAQTKVNRLQTEGFGTAAAANTGTSSGNVPVLGEGGVLDFAVIPGLAGAENNQILIADGNGAAAWGGMSASGNKVVLNLQITVAQASLTGFYIASPIAGTITSIRMVSVGSSFLVNSSQTITPSISGTNITGGAVTVSGATLGVVFSATPTASNTVTAGQAIRFSTSGGGETDAGTLNVSVLIET